MKNPKVSELVYPLMQNLDFVALDADIALGGIDQRHVYVLGREILPKLGFKKPIILLHPLGLSTTAGKMSASEAKGKIELWADPEEIRKTIMKAFCPISNESSSVLEYARYLILPRISILVKTKEGEIEIEEYAELEQLFLSGKIHPADLKLAVADGLVTILEPIRKYVEKNPEVKEVFKK